VIDQFLELNTILQHPKVVVELMVKNKVAPGIVSAICEQHQKIPAGDGKGLKHEEDISRVSFLFVLLSRVLRNRYSCITEMILCNVFIVIYHVDAPL
jgi:hypothetical protein